MSKLTGKTTKWLQDAEKTYLEGMPAITDANRKRLMQIGLDAVQDELKRRAEGEKKSESQTTGNQEPTYQPTTEKEKEEYREYVEAKKEWDSTPREEKARQHKEFITEMDKKHGKNPLLIAPQPKALVKMPAPTKPIKWANGKVYEMNELDLRRKSVDYFSDVLNGKREPKDFYRSTQFNNLVRFQIGLYRFGNEVMEHKALHPTLEMCKKETQERSEELYRQTVEYWKQYKDTDIV